MPLPESSPDAASPAPRSPARSCRARVPTRFVQKYTVRGSAGRVRRPRRRTAARETSPGAARGTWSPATRESGESPTSSSTTRTLYRCATRAAAAVVGAQGKGASLGCARRSRSRLRTSCCTVDRPVHGMGLRGYFLTDTEHGTSHVPCCQTVQPERAFVPDRTAPVSRRRRSSVPGGRLGSTRGLELSPYRVFPHESGRYPSSATRARRSAGRARAPAAGRTGQRPRQVVRSSPALQAVASAAGRRRPLALREHGAGRSSSASVEGAGAAVRSDAWGLATAGGFDDQVNRIPLIGPSNRPRGGPRRSSRPTPLSLTFQTRLYGLVPISLVVVCSCRSTVTSPINTSRTPLSRPRRSARPLYMSAPRLACNNDEMSHYPPLRPPHR